MSCIRDCAASSSHVTSESNANDSYITINKWYLICFNWVIDWLVHAITPWQKVTNILQGSVATCLRCVEIFTMTTLLQIHCRDSQWKSLDSVVQYLLFSEVTGTLLRLVSSDIFLANVAICCRPFVCLSVCRLSSVTLVHPTQVVQIFGNISKAFGTLAIRWHPQKILRRSSQGNPSAVGVKHKWGSKI